MGKHGDYYRNVGGREGGNSFAISKTACSLYSSADVARWFHAHLASETPMPISVGQTGEGRAISVALPRLIGGCVAKPGSGKVKLAMRHPTADKSAASCRSRALPF